MFLSAQTRYPASQSKKKTVQTGLLYLLSCCMVLGFVNLFTLYRITEKYLGSSFIKIAPLTLPVFLFLLFFAIKRLSQYQFPNIGKKWLIVGTGLLILGLFIPDPAIPIKRIHVTEYLLLSLVVRAAMINHLNSLALLLFASLFTSILGVHDELLQGIHPLRTYGLRDMLVNCVSACGGSMIWHGLKLFAQPENTMPDAQANKVTILFTVWLVICLLAMALPLTLYLNASMPLWPFLPLSTIPLYWSLLLFDEKPPLRHCILACIAIILPFFLYPLLINVFSITFY